MEFINSFIYLFEVVWQNRFFHWATLILLAVAAWGEYKSVKQSRRYLKVKSQKNERAIAYCKFKF
jgi:hypothetical protein